MTRQYPGIPVERYADDILGHCGSEAPALREARGHRVLQWHLALHPHKTQIVYGKDTHRRGRYPEHRVDFLGYTVRPRSSKNRRGQVCVSVAPAVSAPAAKAMRQRMRRWRLHHRHDRAVEEIAQWVHPVLAGWVRDDGRCHSATLRRALRTRDDCLVRWAQRKYQRLLTHRRRAGHWLWRVHARQPDLCAHWALGSTVGR